MTETAYKTALIVGVGSGLSASLARIFTKAGLKVALAARRAANLATLAQETGAKSFACDSTSRTDVAKLFADVEAALGAPDVVVYNASYRTRGPFVDLVPDEVAKIADGHRVRRLPGGARGGQAHGAQTPRRDLLYRRFGEREGLCPVGAVRHGQVRACAGWRKAWPANSRRMAFTSAMW